MGTTADEQEKHQPHGRHPKHSRNTKNAQQQQTPRRKREAGQNKTMAKTDNNRNKQRSKSLDRDRFCDQLLTRDARREGADRHESARRCFAWRAATSKPNK